MRRHDGEMEWTGASPHKSALLNRGAVSVDGAKAVVSSTGSLRSALGPLPICTPPLATAKPVNRDAGGEDEEQEIDQSGDKGGVDAAADVLEPFWDMLAALTRGCEAPREFHACSHRRDSSGDSFNGRQQTQQHKVLPTNDTGLLGRSWSTSSSSAASSLLAAAACCLGGACCCRGQRNAHRHWLMLALEAPACIIEWMQLTCGHVAGSVRNGSGCSFEEKEKGVRCSLACDL